MLVILDGLLYFTDTEFATVQTESMYMSLSNCRHSLLLLLGFPAFVDDAFYVLLVVSLIIFSLFDQT